MGVDERTLQRAEREGWATYMPPPVLWVTGALAALVVMLAPLPMYIVVSFIAVVGEFVRHRALDFTTTVVPNAQAFFYYVREVWPFIVSGTILGGVLAVLRQKRGFYYHNVYRYQKGYRLPIGSMTGEPRPSRTYNQDETTSPLASYRRKRHGWYSHHLIMYAAGPIILWGMASYVNPKVYPQMLYNAFAVWLTAGMAARYVWDPLHFALLRWTGKFIGAPRRNLSAEYQFKHLVETDPVLSYATVWDVVVTPRAGRAVLLSNVSGNAQLRRLKELAAFVEGVEAVEVKDITGTTTWGPTPVKHSGAA